MSDVLGLRAFGSGHSEVFLGKDFSSSQDYSDETAAKIDAEIHTIISDAYATAKKLLTDNIAKLHFVSEFLVKNEVMDAEQFAAAMDGDPTFEELEEMTESKKRKSREENDRKRAELLAEERKLKEAEEKARREAERSKDANRYDRDGDSNNNGNIGPDGNNSDGDDGNDDQSIPF
jgi:cell division protease FtsH